MEKFRKKPVVVEAVQWDGKESSIEKIFKFVGKNTGISYSFPDGTLRIPTLEGVMIASSGDWIIKGVNGEFYPCKPDIFEKTYERVIE